MTEVDVKVEPKIEVKDEPTGNGHQANGPPAEVAKKIIEQVEYYFGDINLPRDKFLQDELKKEDGWVALETMLKFNRLRQLCSDVEQLANVLQDSLLIHVSDDNQKIRRNPEIPLPENSLEYWQEVKNRTVYIKGFPIETKLDEIMEFMQPHGPIQNILMRRIKGEKTFKGSVFVTFKEKETAQKFVQNDEAKDYAGHALSKLMQMDYWTQKNKENKERKEAARSLKQSKNKEAQDETKKSQHAPTFIKGTVLQIEGIQTEKFEPEKFRELIPALKEFFKPHGEVGYIARVGDSDKIDLRFNTSEENFASKAWDAAVAAVGTDGKVVFDGDELKARILEGEEEQRYWAEFTKGKLAKVERGKQSHRGRGGKSGNRGGGRGGRSGRDGAGDKPKADASQRKHTIFKDSDDEADEAVDEPPVKKVKEESNGDSVAQEGGGDAAATKVEPKTEPVVKAET